MSPVHLTLINNIGYVFDANDYMKLRCEHQIVGKLIGSSVKWPRNTSLAGLPAIYTPNQIQLMLEKGFIKLFRQNLNDSSNDNIKTTYADMLKVHENEFSKCYYQRKIQETENRIDKIIEGKRKKAIALGSNPDEVTKETVLDQMKQRWQFDLENILIQVPSKDTFSSELEEITSIEGIVPIKYRVFCDLWERGKWITSGETFGGDFLVYPGEPLYFHASHIVHVLTESETINLSSNLFIAKARMSVAVNKLCIFAYENQETKEIKYQTCRWLGK